MKHLTYGECLHVTNVLTALTFTIEHIVEHITDSTDRNEVSCPWENRV